jgi:SAM-dependent methyltransferase
VTAKLGNRKAATIKDLREPVLRLLVQNGDGDEYAAGNTAAETGFSKNVPQLVTRYESLAFEDVHAALLDLFPGSGATILKAGSGSGRDAAWFASHGYDVVAVEPSDAMLTLARTAPVAVDSLAGRQPPELAQVRRLGLTFDLILLTAVWMHVPPASRARFEEACHDAFTDRAHCDRPAPGRARCIVTNFILFGSAPLFGTRSTANTNVEIAHVFA